MQVEQAPTITPDEIAALLSMQPATFKRKRHRLIQEGMPRPVPGADLLWSRRNILKWIDGELAPAGLEAASAFLEAAR